METMIPYNVVRFCSIECRLQMSGELSVLHMVNGWQYAKEQYDKNAKLPIVLDVLRLGMAVEPVENKNGFRRCGVQIGYDIKPTWEEIPTQIHNLIVAVHEGGMKADEFFFEYETVHPFGDGNGRTGVLLWNWINGTLDAPKWAPNYWNDRRRTVDYGA